MGKASPCLGPFPSSGASRSVLGHPSHMDVTHVVFLTRGRCHLALQLVLTVGLLAVVVYLYTVVAFNFFRKFYNKSEDGDTPDMKCDDMLTVSPCPVVLREWKVLLLLDLSDWCGSSLTVQNRK